MSKPIPGKAYGSIPHLPGSRLGSGDYHCDAGQVEIATGLGRRPSERCRDRVIVTEKLDGGCTAIARIEGRLLALIRAGYLANSSPFEHLRLFAHWVDMNIDRFNVLAEGERMVGEWMAIGHGTRYQLHGEPFIPFDIMTGFGNKGRRLPHDQARRKFENAGLVAAKVLHDGGPLTLDEARRLLGPYGHHGALEAPEGVVYRVETDGDCNFLCKWVDPNKLDGRYLPEFSGAAPIIQWPSEAYDVPAFAKA